MFFEAIFFHLEKIVVDIRQVFIEKLILKVFFWFKKGGVAKLCHHCYETEYLIVIALANLFFIGAQGIRMAACLVGKYNCIYSGILSSVICICKKLLFAKDLASCGRKEQTVY
jgi:hypothetical protein